jgi:hypothetical protein
MKKTYLVSLVLFLLILFGFYLRAINASPFKFYPDSYQNLIVAKNIQDYGSVVGTLGEKGMIYPPFFMWSRPVYPLLISGLDNLVDERINIDTDDLIQSAELISFFMGLFTIPLSYFFLKAIFKGRKIALLGAFLLTISFNHSVWGGYIYTETTGLFFMFLMLLILFKVYDKRSQLLDLKDFLLGGSFTLAIFARFEYALLALPISYLILKKAPNPKIKLFNFFLFTLIFSSFFLISLYPVQETLEIFFLQNQRMLIVGGIILAVSAGLPIVYQKYFKNRIKLKDPYSLISKIIFIIFILLTAAVAVNEVYPNFYHIRGLINFYKTDLLLVISAYVGISMMYRHKLNITLANFILISFAVLTPIYYQINPEMQRYFTHLIPFFLIAATYGFFVILSEAKNLLRMQGSLMYLKQVYDPGRVQRSFTKVQDDNKRILAFVRMTTVIAFLLLVPLYQIYLTMHGIRNWHEGSWTRASYEEKSAKIIQSKLKDTNDPLIIASFPEPYYIFTNHVTHSINDNPPYLYIDQSLDSKDAYIIQDMGMADIFPNFSKFLDENLKDYKVDEYRVGEIYHYRTRSEKETKPVNVFKIPLKTLREIITEKEKRSD